MVIKDQAIRDELLIANGNIVVGASAGTGKTYTIIERIICDINENSNYKTYAVTTFTRKATNEIRSRLGMRRGDGYVGTNDNFVLNEIIQPFIADAYGAEYDKQVTPDFTNERSKATFQELLNIVKTTPKGYICKYSSNKKNFSFELALNILEKSHVARRYLKSKYYRIYVDEYQDSDDDMHKLFKYLSSNLGISLFVVGDEKQSIYSFKGGSPVGLNEFINDKTNFSYYRLSHNFRSNQEIQNYANLFMSESIKDYAPCQNTCKVRLIKCNSYLEPKFIDYMRTWLKETSSVAFFVKTHNEGIRMEENLKKNDLEFIYIPKLPLQDPEIESTHVWIARNIASYFLTDSYTEFDFYDEIPMPESYAIKDVKQYLKQIQNNFEQCNLVKFRDECRLLYDYLTDEVENEKFDNEIVKLLETINDMEKYYCAYNIENYKAVITTLHSSKGLQYEQVIISSNSFYHSNSFSSELHYVAITRPQDELLILDNDGRYDSELISSLSEAKNVGVLVEKTDVITIV